jgi:hypothetical protein
LDIVGSTASNNPSIIRVLDNTVATVYYLQSTDATQTTLGTVNNTPLALTTNSTPRFQITAAGNVTINAPSSGTALHIGAAAGAIAADVNADGAGTYYEVGFRDIPLNTQSGATYTFALTDRGKYVFGLFPGAQAVTIPANGSVAFPVGTVITYLNRGSSASTIAITTDTLRWAGNASTGTRTISATNGLATLLKISATEWLISGAGVS